MSDFIKTLTHGRRLVGAVKELSVDELILVVEKLNKIIESKKEKEQKLAAAEQQKKAKLEDIRQQLKAAGLGVEDLTGVISLKTSKRAGQKRPVKYILTDKDGKQHPWTGIGRMPKVFAQALAEGKPLSEFAV